MWWYATVLSTNSLHWKMINRALQEFSAQWNNHALSTESSLSPYQLWVGGMVNHCNSQSTAVQDVMQNSTTDQVNQYSNYGIEESGPVPEQEDYRVSIPQSSISLTPAQLQHVSNVIEASRDDNGITSYLLCVNIVNSFIN